MRTISPSNPLVEAETCPVRCFHPLEIEGARQSLAADAAHLAASTSAPMASKDGDPFTQFGEAQPATRVSGNAAGRVKRPSPVGYVRSDSIRRCLSFIWNDQTAFLAP